MIKVEAWVDKYLSCSTDTRCGVFYPYLPLFVITIRDKYLERPFHLCPMAKLASAKYGLKTVQLLPTMEKKKMARLVFPH